MPVFPILLFTLLTQGPSDHPVQWSAQAVPSVAGGYEVQLKASIAEGWYMYATELPGDEGPIPTSFHFQPSESYALDGPLLEPGPLEQYDPNFAMTVRFHKGSPVFVQRVRSLTTEGYAIQGEVEFMCCTDKTCLPPRAVPFRVDIPSTDR